MKGIASMEPCWMSTVQYQLPHEAVKAMDASMEPCWMSTVQYSLGSPRGISGTCFNGAVLDEHGAICY